MEASVGKKAAIEKRKKPNGNARRKAANVKKAMNCKEGKECKWPNIKQKKLTKREMKKQYR